MPVAQNVGISDIAIYLPKLKIDLEKIIEKRVKENSAIQLEKWKKILTRTGIFAMHFPDIWEDSVTMAAQAAANLIRRKKIQLDALRYLVTGTETGVDHSKPLAAYVSGILRKAGMKIPESISTFQTQHACAGGTVALLGVCALLSVAGRTGESGIVMCSDVAKYEKSTSAEMTQGAGAVAMVAETNPRLIQFDLPTVGYSSKDVDDFFRPLGSETAKVKGSFSVRCYREAVESALLDHASRSNQSVAEVLLNTDMFAMHVPYPKLPEDTMRGLLKKYTEMDATAIDQFLNDKGFNAMIYPASRSGNIYSGAMFMSLAFLLKDRLEKFGDDIVGKTILMGSYGSGNTMVLLAGKIAADAPEVIRSWDLESVWNGETASIDQYEIWASTDKQSPEEYSRHLQEKLSRVEPNSIYLNRIREDGYREYFCHEHEDHHA